MFNSEEIRFLREETRRLDQYMLFNSGRIQEVDEKVQLLLEYFGLTIEEQPQRKVVDSKPLKIGNPVHFKKK